MLDVLVAAIVIVVGIEISLVVACISKGWTKRHHGRLSALYGYLNGAIILRDLWYP